MHFKTVLVSAVLLASSLAHGQKYCHNLILHPVLEGVSIGYEFAPDWGLSKRIGFRGTYQNRQNDGNSIQLGLSGFKEHKIQLQTKVYMSNKNVMGGFFQGLEFRAKKIDGIRNNFFFEDRFAFPPFDPISLNIKSSAMSVGYVLGYQKIFKNGFNAQLSVSSSYQWAKDDYYFDAHWLDLIHHNPYNKGLIFSAQLGLGLAF